MRAEHLLTLTACVIKERQRGIPTELAKQLWELVEPYASEDIRDSAKRSGVNLKILKE